MDVEKAAYDLQQKYSKRMEKKMQGKPQAVKIIMSRTFSSAIMILQTIADIPFEKLAFSIYDFCIDLQFKEIVRLFDAELELAGINQEKFIFDLYPFYNKVSNKIRKENKYQEFAEYIGMVVRLHREKKEKVGEKVVDAYLSMILQTLEYLRKDKFDLDTCAYGVSTNGELLMGPYPLAYSDLPGIEFEEAIKNGKKFKSQMEAEQFVYDLYAKRGITVKSTNDLEILAQAQKIHAVTTTALFPFINEFTFDIVPVQFYSSNIPPLMNMKVCGCDIKLLKSKLQRRNRTLPTNGVIFEINDESGELTGALMKEIMYYDSIYLLYRLDTNYGSLAGYYDTKDKFLFSITQDATSKIPYQNLSALILSMYASQVLTGIVDDYDRNFLQDDCPIQIRAFNKSGKLQNQYNVDPKAKHLTIRNLDDYNKEERYINVIIRKLPEGKQASVEAKQLAEQYGYDLEPGQTFVRPFVKQVFVKKDK